MRIADAIIFWIKLYRKYILKAKLLAVSNIEQGVFIYVWCLFHRKFVSGTLIAHNHMPSTIWLIEVELANCEFVIFSMHIVCPNTRIKNNKIGLLFISVFSFVLFYCGFGSSYAVRGKLPLRCVPHDAFSKWMAESTVFFKSCSLPNSGLISVMSTARKRPVSHRVSNIVIPSRTLKPPGTKRQTKKWNFISLFHVWNGFSYVEWRCLALLVDPRRQYQN